MQDGNKETLKAGKFAIMRPMWSEAYDDRVFVFSTNNRAIYEMMRKDEELMRAAMKSVRLMHSAQTPYVQAEWLAGRAMYRSTTELMKQLGLDDMTVFTVSQELVMLEALKGDHSTKH